VRLLNFHFSLTYWYKTDILLCNGVKKPPHDPRRASARRFAFAAGNNRQPDQGKGVQNDVHSYGRHKPVQEGDYTLALLQTEESMEIEYKEINDAIYRKSIELYGEWIDKYIHIREDTFALAALNGDTPVGFVCVTPRALPYPLEQFEDAYIEVLEVHEDYRRRGIGQHLVQASIDWATEARFRQIRTHHNDAAAAAIQLSYKLGFGMCPHDYVIDGEQHSGYFVAKVLNT